MKKIKTIILGLVATATIGSTVPVFPGEYMQLIRSYSFDYIEIVQETSPTSTPEIKEYPFPDKDGDGKGASSIFINSKGELVEVEITLEAYHKMGIKGGGQFNTKKKEYLSLIGMLRPEIANAAPAYDSTSVGKAEPGTSITVSHTVSSSGNPYLVVVTRSETLDSITGVTYDGTSMTKINDLDATTNIFGTSWYLGNPSTGANNIVITSGSSQNISYCASSYTGMENQAPEANNSIGPTNDDPIVLGVTTLTDNAWLVGGTVGNRNFDSGTNSTVRESGTNARQASCSDSNGALSPTGAYNMEFEQSGAAASNAAFVFALAPVIEDTCTPPGSGDWEVDLADNCWVSSDIFVNGTIFFYGVGTFQCTQENPTIVAEEIVQAHEVNGPLLTNCHLLIRDLD